ncbi:hypothetical protein V1477_008168 [Vespula maculifrons]|uniref:Uncharacterized protein n=1 Tax=Vespula maculifrons TaxID=7453 RepID=A0ABD2CD55_VESMC
MEQSGAGLFMAAMEDRHYVVNVGSTCLYLINQKQSLDMPGSPEHIEVYCWRSTELFYNSSFIFSVECG